MLILRGRLESEPHDRSRPAHLSGAERIALAALALAAIAVIPGAFNRFVFGKVAIATLAVMCGAIAPSRGRLPRTACVLLLGATVLLAIATLTSSNPSAQLLGLPPRYEGILVLPVYVGALVTGARLLGPGRSNGATYWFLQWLSVAALAVAVVAVLEAAGLEPLPGTGARPGSLSGNASDEGALALLYLGPLLAVAAAGRRPLHIAGAVAAAIALVSSSSRGALVGLVVLAVTLIVASPRRGLAATSAFTVATILAIAFALPGVRHRILETSPLAGKTATGRLLLLGEAAHLVAREPIAGFGASSFADDIPQEHTLEYERVVGPANPPDSPHNWVLQAAVAGGVGLSLIAIALAFLTTARGWRGISTQPTMGEAAAYAGLLAGLLGYAGALMFHFTSPGTTPLAAAFAGALLATRPAAAFTVRAKLDGLWRAATVMASSALLLPLVAAGAGEIPLRSAVLAAARGELGGANRRFHDAVEWRPWDLAVPTIATHAFAALTAAGLRQAAHVGAPWAVTALADDPRSVPVLEDATTIALARGRRTEASLLLARAQRLEPNNASLLARRRELLR